MDSINLWRLFGSVGIYLVLVAVVGWLWRKDVIARGRYVRDLELLVRMKNEQIAMLKQMTAKDAQAIAWLKSELGAGEETGVGSSTSG